MRFAGAIAIALLSCGFVSLPIEEIANSSRTDACASDGKGGWLDLGSNDLSILPAGENKYVGVRFAVAPAGDETARNCLVLGRRGAEARKLKLASAVADRRLFLLHAVDGAPAAETGKTIGKIVLRYDDGTISEKELATGRDVSEWTCGRSFSNAVRAWTAYNNHTQISLFVSSFELEKGKKLSEVTFSANGSCAWMIVAASTGGKMALKPICGSIEITGTFKSPEPPPLLVQVSGKKPKNIILIIGDGMGQGAARLASYYKYGREDGCYFQQFPVVGLCSTFSASSPVTDSAASGTAIATGTKTTNGVLGQQVDARHDRKHPVFLTSVAARAHEKGMGVAILTSDALHGATPAAFFAHVDGRGEKEKISLQASSCGYEALIGSAQSESAFRPASSGGKRADGRDLIADMESRGYAFARKPGEIAAAPKDRKIIGLLSTFGGETSIAEAMSAVLDRIADRAEGFFMMAECCETDHSCHNNNAADAIKAVSMVEFMAKTAIDFANSRGDTLVLVTADHDTGHPCVLRGRGKEGRLHVFWPEVSHSKFPVPIYAFGPGAEFFEGLIDNTDIAKNVAKLLGL